MPAAVQARAGSPAALCSLFAGMAIGVCLFSGCTRNSGLRTRGDGGSGAGGAAAEGAGGAGGNAPAGTPDATVRGSGGRGAGGDTRVTAAAAGSGGAGGAGGARTAGSGGAGGSASMAPHCDLPRSRRVQGGYRSFASTGCLSAAPAANCAAEDEYWTCMQSECGTRLSDCWAFWEDASLAGCRVGYSGRCTSYAECIVDCPCDADRWRCEADCVRDQVLANPDCSACAAQVVGCVSARACAAPPSCAAVQDAGIRADTDVAADLAGEAGSAGSDGGGAVAGAALPDGVVTYDVRPPDTPL
jgi:hypothetical protein